MLRGVFSRRELDFNITYWNLSGIVHWSHSMRPVGCRERNLTCKQDCDVAKSSVWTWPPWSRGTAKAALNRPYIFCLWLHIIILSKLTESRKREPVVHRLNDLSLVTQHCYCPPTTFLVCVISRVRSRDSSVGMESGYGLAGRGVCIRVSVEARVSSSSCRRTGWGPPSLLSNGYRALFPGG
jgi:hypothetical protein